MRILDVTTAFALVLALSTAVSAQDQSSTTSTVASSAQSSDGAGQGGGYGRRGGFGMGMMGRGISGTVTESAADHFAVKTFTGDTYTIHFSDDTRMMKQGPGMRGRGRQGNGAGNGEARDRSRGYGGGFGGNPPEMIKSADIKVGDAISSMGDVDADAKTVSARTVVLLDPERAKQMEEMEASYGKTWLMGKVTAVDGVKVTLTGTVDNAPHSFVADENTTFRRRRDPITLADIQVGDVVRAEGAVKDGVFTATNVGDMGAMQGGPPRVPGNGQPPAQ
ncbi:MAG TPA: DUF5666 domain-containing protein [Terracidiphilus sp.]|nr:DUF5666 domain-containing protein [Terracidiphilus sp.]